MLKDLLVSGVRVKILRLFFKKGAPEFLHIRDITRQVGTEINAVRRELLRLTRAGLLKREPRGNRVYFRLRREYIFFDDLLSQVAKETGLGGELRAESDRLGNLKLILMSKLFYGGRVSKSTEVDLLILGKVDLPALEKLIREEEKRIGHEINYTVLTEDEFEFRKKRKDPFIANILLEPRLVIFGNEEKYVRLAV